MSSNYTKTEDEFLMVIGKVTIYSQYIEDGLCSLIGALISNDERLGKLITIPLSTRQLPEYAFALFEYRVKDENRVSDFHKIIKQIRTLLEKRNEIVHAVWAHETEDEIFEQYKPQLKTKGKQPKDRGLRLTPTKHNASELNTVAIKMSETANELHNVIMWYVLDRRLMELKDEKNKPNTSQDTKNS
ncbi:MAG: hypothetical protein ACHQQQ_13905 [Bacteroidota bacterium]